MQAHATPRCPGLPPSPPSLGLPLLFLLLPLQPLLFLGKCQRRVGVRPLAALVSLAHRLDPRQLHPQPVAALQKLRLGRAGPLAGWKHRCRPRLHACRRRARLAGARHGDARRLGLSTAGSRWRGRGQWRGLRLLCLYRDGGCDATRAVGSLILGFPAADNTRGRLKLQLVGRAL